MATINMSRIMDNFFDRISNSDKDFRFMAMSDLIAEMQKDSFPQARGRALGRGVPFRCVFSGWAEGPYKTDLDRDFPPCFHPGLQLSSEYQSRVCKALLDRLNDESGERFCHCEGPRGHCGPRATKGGARANGRAGFGPALLPCPARPGTAREQSTEEEEEEGKAAIDRPGASHPGSGPSAHTGGTRVHTQAALECGTTARGEGLLCRSPPLALLFPFPGDITALAVKCLSALTSRLLDVKVIEETATRLCEKITASPAKKEQVRGGSSRAYTQLASSSSAPLGCRLPASSDAPGCCFAGREQGRGRHRPQGTDQRDAEARGGAGSGPHGDAADAGGSR